MCSVIMTSTRTPSPIICEPSARRLTRHLRRGNNPPLRIRSSSFLHGLFWTILCGAFVVIGAQRVWPTLKTGQLRPMLPNDSTDRYLESLYLTNGSERILAALEGTPRDKPLALVLPDAEKKSAFIYQLVTYLAWPREVRWVVLKPETAAAQLQSLDARSLAAIFFWGIRPPDSLGPGNQIGPSQTIVSLPQASPAHP